MIKNEVLYIKIIFKIYLKILKISKKHFKLSNKLLFHKILKNNFQKLFLKINFKNSYKKRPYSLHHFFSLEFFLFFIFNFFLSLLTLTHGAKKSHSNANLQ